jgi:protein involved in polysaccharide export with SLBB domain
MPVPAYRVLVFLLLTLLYAPYLAQAGDTRSGFALGTGDKVRIAVFGEPDLSVSEWVSARGTIPYPLLGELQVLGLTPSDLEHRIASRLKGPYLVDPKVTVSVDEYRPFFVMGQVNRPGSYPYSPGMTVRKAISFAGGFTDRASRGKIFLSSEQAPQEERRVDESDAIGPGDTVIVKGSFF